jgi:hypothetical protein
MADTALATQEQHLTKPAPVTFEQLDLLRRTLAEGATDDELRLHIFNCQRLGVHPLDGLIHFTKRGGKYVPVTSINYLRSRADETGLHMGTSRPDYSGVEGAEDFECCIVVFKQVQGQRCEFYGIARFDEFVPADEKSGHMWRKMPRNQLAKCAEAQGLRKAFPQQLNGLYIAEELEWSKGPQAPQGRTVRRASEQKKDTAGTMQTGPLQVLDVKAISTTKGEAFFVKMSDQQEYSTRDADFAAYLRGLKGGTGQVRLRYRVNEHQGRTYRNIEDLDTAEDPPPIDVPPQ